MAGLTLVRGARSLVVDDTDDGVTTYVSVRPLQTANRSWQPELNASLQSGLARLGYPQPNEVIEANRAPPPDPWRLVAPGVIVRASEYAARYGHLDLDGLRRQLSPEVFRAFVRHIGTIEGPEGVDVNLLVNEETN